MSYNAYRQTQQRSEDPRATEYRLFGEVTRALIEARELPKRDPKVIKALDWNRRMWSTLSIDCGAPGNKLPDQLRASIVSLGIWVSKHSSQVMRSGASIEPLINVNRTVMEGLKPKSQATQTSQTNTNQTEGRQTGTHQASSPQPRLSGASILSI